ncbi:MAG: hypothetical protein PHW67_04335, partial [Bacilli bacterium]|nr:hypothetical protein [Bacilli bacterium]
PIDLMMSPKIVPIKVQQEGTFFVHLGIEICQKNKRWVSSFSRTVAVFAFYYIYYCLFALLFYCKNKIVKIA